MKFLPLVLLVLCTLRVCGQEERLQPVSPKVRTAEELAAQTVVVFNENDLDSVALAGRYAELRGIPIKNLVGIKCAVTEEITRFDYDNSIAEPLRKAFVARGWWKLRPEANDAGRVEQSKIRFVALMRGIPLKISATTDYKGDEPTGTPQVIYDHNEAAVDSELSVLGLWSKQISGRFENPFYREVKTIGETDYDSMLLVCRLDAPRPAIVETMMKDAVEVEKQGLRGFLYVDTLGMRVANLRVGHECLQDAVRDARENGLPVIMDSGPALFPSKYPMKHAALYLGWYNDEVVGPFADADFRFPRGAVAYHIHSFSGVTLRDEHKNWCGPLLKAGAAATMGNVYEPFLGLLPRPNVFAQRLREGFTFAEAAYMSQQYLSWMTTFVGDPLYRPFANIKTGTGKTDNEWDAYRDGVSIWINKGRKEGETALRAAAAKLKSGVVYESLGLLEQSGNDHPAAIEAFAQARAVYGETADRVRVAVHESSSIRTAKGRDAAVKFLKGQIADQSGPHVEVLRLMAGAMASEEAAAPKTGPAKPEAAPAKKKGR